jgi:hypothetical protein
MNVLVQICTISSSASHRYDIVEHLTKSTFPKWKNAMELFLAFNNFDYASRENKPTVPTAGLEELELLGSPLPLLCGDDIPVPLI